MKTFDRIVFFGKFRDYQQAVLDRSQKHLRDGRIHIVAAPGSGKTILGLELIRRLNRPALVLSPSVTIRQQWGERFESNYVPQGMPKEGYVSYDLKNPELITSVTYQALHAAFTKTQVDEQAGEDELETEEAQDFSSFNLMKTIKDNGIGTICLDEAHHLRNEWQKALEGFMAQLGSDVKVIALTATPPYDSTPGEWKSYSTVCGEIDEEIFVPQLVAQKTLCPHQDYIYFNYPTAEETEILKAHKARALSTAEEMITGGMVAHAVGASGIIEGYAKNENLILENAKDFSAFLCLAKRAKVAVPDKLVKLASPSGGLPEYRLDVAETAFQLVLDKPEIFTQEISEAFRTVLAQNGLIEKKKVCLTTSEKINKMLISSVGKLNSINEIVLAEAAGFGDKLRMLILTDYIKKDMLKLVGTAEAIGTIGAVPVFESVRRVVGEKVKTAVLSGGLVIVPSCIAEQVAAIAQTKQVPHTLRPIAGTEHCEIVFSGSNKNKVSIITEAFEQGLINILIGTKSLLGEGWDAPCINSLILASFVGSFMLSNQMRGRAIRTDRNAPDKASNIWHLVTVEPELTYDNQTEQALFTKYAKESDKLVSDDYDTMERRFSCFLAPAYHSNIIESGTDRIDILKPPFDAKGIAGIDSQMLSLAADKKGMVERWSTALGGCKKPEILEVNEISPLVRPSGMFAKKVILELVWAALFVLMLVLGSGESTLLKLLGAVGGVFAGVMLLRGLAGIMRFAAPERFVKAFAGGVLKTLRRMGEIESNSAKVAVEKQAQRQTVYCMLNGATVHEKNVFAKAMGELFSEIDDPRYVLVRYTKLFGSTSMDYSKSYACPAVIGTKKENVELLAKNIKCCIGNAAFFYTRNDAGRAELLKCRKKSYMNANEFRAKGKKVAKTTNK